MSINQQCYDIKNQMFEIYNQGDLFLQHHYKNIKDAIIYYLDNNDLDSVNEILASEYIDDNIQGFITAFKNILNPPQIISSTQNDTLTGGTMTN